MPEWPREIEKWIFDLFPKKSCFFLWAKKQFLSQGTAYWVGACGVTFFNKRNFSRRTPLAMLVPP
jgi:hypothetical protein